MIGRQTGRRLRHHAAVGLALAGLGGCGRTHSVESAIADPTATACPQEATLTWAADWNQPFEDAVTTQAPAGANLPVERTVAGKSTAQLRAAVEKAWPAVRLTDAAGRLAPIPVALDTAEGRIELSLFPDAAPNHVRNFLALAQVGFYDGLVFERSVRQEVVSQGAAGGRMELLTGGCPNGDGDVGTGHIGYFLKPETNALGHEEGTVGFWRDDDSNSAGTRFYICLSPAPFLNGHFTPFGKVTGGLAVARAIAARPAGETGGEQPKSPVAITGVRRK